MLARLQAGTRNPYSSSPGEERRRELVSGAVVSTLTLAAFAIAAMKARDVSSLQPRSACAGAGPDRTRSAIPPADRRGQ